MNLAPHLATTEAVSNHIRMHVANPVERVQVAMVVAAALAIELAGHDLDGAKKLCDAYSQKIHELFADGTLAIPHEVHG